MKLENSFTVEHQRTSRAGESGAEFRMKFQVGKEGRGLSRRVANIGFRLITTKTQWADDLRIPRVMLNRPTHFSKQLTGHLATIANLFKVPHNIVF